MTREELIAHSERRFEDYANLARLASQFLARKVRIHFPDTNLPLLHLVEHRAKSTSSLKANLDAGRYESVSLETITDLAGARLVFYFWDDIDEFMKKASFEAWFGHGTSARHVQGSKQPDGSRAPVGYQSWHLILKVVADNEFFRALNDDHQKRLGNLYCEVQIRTLLQHAWAETEHDLRYKVENISKGSFPSELSKKLLNLSGLIDTADEQLASVKKEVTDRFGLQRLEKRTPLQLWRYLEPAYAPCFQFKGVRYPYELLDIGGAPLVVREKADIFNIDVQMMKALKIDRYKKKMWDKLRTEEPQWITTIDHETLTTRVCDWDTEQRIMTVQPAYYTDQVVTNHVQVLDKEIVECSPPCKVRDLGLDGNGNLLSFRQSPLSNTLGVACVLRVAGSFWIASQRSKSVAFDSGKLGCSASGALEWSELGCWTGRDFLSWCAGGMARELTEELGLDVEPNQFAFVGLAREFGRVGKPQLFFFLDQPNIGYATVEMRWRTYTALDAARSTSKEEFTRIVALEDRHVPTLIGASADAINALPLGCTVSDELRMNLALAQRFIEGTV